MHVAAEVKPLSMHSWSVLLLQQLQQDAERSAAGAQVTAVAYDNPIPGFNTNNTINLRLWAAKPDTEFDLEAFNTGDYVQVHFNAAAPCTGSHDDMTSRNGL